MRLDDVCGLFVLVRLIVVLFACLIVRCGVMVVLFDVGLFTYYLLLCLIFGFELMCGCLFGLLLVVRPGFDCEFVELFSVGIVYLLCLCFIMIVLFDVC